MLGRAEDSKAPSGLFMRLITILLTSALAAGCAATSAGRDATPAPTPADFPAAVSFAYPLGPTGRLTPARDKKDDWYDAQDFGRNDHLGEDWNKNSGGNTDCGEQVFAVADGKIVYAADAGPGWGNVIIVEHRLADGTRVQSLYGHLSKMIRNEGIVAKREPIGEIGNAAGRYYCHLHLEIRLEDCPEWSKPGGGYSKDRKGWTDPSDFIDARP